MNLNRKKVRNEKKYGEEEEIMYDIWEIGIVMYDGENVGWDRKNSWRLKFCKCCPRER